MVQENVKIKKNKQKKARSEAFYVKIIQFMKLRKSVTTDLRW